MHTGRLPGIVTFCIAALAGCTAPGGSPGENVKQARFDWFEYRGEDRIFAEPLPAGHYRNPIIAGFYPDPSITRAGDDFYMVHSSFAYYPGVPVFHSTDLVNWRPLGHALTRPGQVDLDGLGVSRGIFAPTIRFHEGTFYLITTAVDAGGNFLVTARDPAGPWSDPVWLPEIDGIDPDIFFDDDGRVYIAHNGPPEGEPLYEGHRAIWLWEYDLQAQQVVKDSGRVIVNGGTDLSAEPIWIEAPHLYKKDGWYYLLCAEGGTGYNHSEVVFRARSLNGPFVPYENNPILTQRDLDIDRPFPVTSAGHADMVRTPAGQWWAVFLATRPYDRRFYNTGRETFLLPVTWRDGWPHILPPGEPVPYQARKPAGLPPTPGAEPTTGNFVWRDDFEGTGLSPHWNLLRSGGRDWYRIDGVALTLEPRAVSLADLRQPAFVGRRQQHTAFEVRTELELPLQPGLSAGLAAFQNETHHYFLGVERAGDRHRVFLELANGTVPERIHSAAVTGSPRHVVLGAEGDAETIGFFYLDEDGERTDIAADMNARLLSTEVAGGFVGAYLGVHTRLTEIGD